MARIFIRGEDDCGRGKLSAKEYINQFKTPVLFGRTEDISQLDDAWVNPDTRLLHINAPAGTGKTALIDKWLHLLQKKHWHDAEAIYVWTFYPPDLTRPVQNPVDSFFEHALEWFSDEETADCPSPNLLQGECLAKLIQAHHTLLILDGLETLQLTSSDMAGELIDPRLRHLLAQLQVHNPGLCITLSRQPFREDESSDCPGLQHHTLPPLPTDECVQLLRYKGTQGGDERLQQIAHDYERHPLTLTLLGGYLNVWHAGDWRQMEKIPVLMDQQAEGRQARRILVANSAELNNTEGEALLYLLSLLHQPIHLETVDALVDKKRAWSIRLWGKRQDTWADLLKPLLRQNTQQRQHIIRRLQELGLLVGKGRCLLAPQWVREAFGRQFKHDWPNAWKEANQQLINYAQTLPAKVPVVSTEIVPEPVEVENTLPTQPETVTETPVVEKHTLAETTNTAQEKPIETTEEKTVVQEQEAIVDTEKKAIAEESVEQETVVVIEEETTAVEPISQVEKETTIETPTTNVEEEITITESVDDATEKETAIDEPAVVAEEETVVEEQVVAAEEEAILEEPITTEKPTSQAKEEHSAEKPVVITKPQPQTTAVAKPSPQPLLSDVDLSHLDDLSKQLEQFRSAMQMLQVRTRKFQKHVRQLDKEIETVQYQPQRKKTGTNG